MQYKTVKYGTYGQNLLVLLDKVLLPFSPSQSEMPMFLSPQKSCHAYLNYFLTHIRQEREQQVCSPDNPGTLLYVLQ